MPESLEQLDLLLMHEVRARKIRRDGIHFQGLRYLSLTLAAYVGEDAAIRLLCGFNCGSAFGLPELLNAPNSSEKERHL
jgi:hypothetical protein